MGLFITSEVLFFFAFFWAFFWGALYPPMTVATSWPPEGITPVPTWQIPFLNTMILLLSGRHRDLGPPCRPRGDQQTAFRALLLTVCSASPSPASRPTSTSHSIAEGFTLQKGIYRLDLLHGDRLPRLPCA